MHHKLQHSSSVDENSAARKKSCCPAAIKGPAILSGVGASFVLLGMLPFVITLQTGKNSATLIGLGFMGFGALLLIPGLFWCIVVYTQRRIYRPWKKSRFSRRSQEETPALRYRALSSSQEGAHEDQIA